MVLQVARLRLVSVTDRLPHSDRAAGAAAAVVRRKTRRRGSREGLRISRECVQAIAAEAAAAGARTMVMLMPARFQVDDADYGRLKEAVSGAGGTLVRDAATDALRRSAGAARAAAVRRAAAAARGAARARTCSSSRRCT